MKITTKLHDGNLSNMAYPCLVAPVYEDRKLPSALKDLDKAWKGLISTSVKNEVLTEEGELFIVPTPLSKGILRIGLVGMGKRDEVNLETLRRVGAKSANSLRKRDISRICFLVEPFEPVDLDPAGTGLALLEGAHLGAYSFDEFKKEKDTHVLTSVELHFPKGTKTSRFMPDVNETLTLTTSTLIARDWCNTPGNLATPTHLAQLAKDIAKEAGLTVKILERRECEKLGMGAFLGVSQGSEEPPKFIILDYKPRKYSKTIALIGKAVTFDSGGISIKPSKDMHIMKADKGGGIAVLATMRAVGLLNPGNARVIAVVPACENLPSGSAMKPGDIVRSQSGKSIEVINCDAEGRLIMADGLEYARREYQPDAMIDVATLTGACVIALGDDIAGYWTDYEDLAAAMDAAAEKTGEPVWRMPMYMDYDKHLKSDCADTTNVGKREGGAITAALFLKKFVDETPWLHLDIAGPMWSTGDKPYIPKAATGYGPRLLFNWIRNLSGD